MNPLSLAVCSKLLINFSYYKDDDYLKLNRQPCMLPRELNNFLFLALHFKALAREKEERGKRECKEGRW